MCLDFSTVQDRNPLHHSNQRDVSRIKANLAYSQETKMIIQQNNKFIIFDDILTTGATFKAHKNIILDLNPQADVKGIMLGKSKIIS